MSVSGNASNIRMTFRISRQQWSVWYILIFFSNLQLEFLSYYLTLQGAITKRMTAIEEMAGMDVLCSDKTGTLTLNRLTVDRNLIEVQNQISWLHILFIWTCCSGFSLSCDSHNLPASREEFKWPVFWKISRLRNTSKSCKANFLSI